MIGFKAFALLLASNDVFIHCLAVFDAAAFVCVVVGMPELFKSKLSIPGYYMLMPRLEFSPLLVKPWCDRRIAE